MIARLKIVSLLAATLLMGVSQAWAQPMGEPAYRTDYYNNAGHDTLVGTIFPNGCSYDDLSEVDIVNYRLVGSQTNYPDQELVGYCYQGEYNPV
jgi:hypothetical protein